MADPTANRGAPRVDGDRHPIRDRPFAVIRFTRARRVFAPAIAATLICLLGAGRSLAQDMEPRIYSASPIDTNILSAGYAYLTGALVVKPPSLITNVTGEIDGPGIGYDRTFDLAGHTARFGIALPYRQFDVSADILGQRRHIAVSGVGDLVMRVGVNLVGNPSMTPAQFEKREPTTTVGAGVIVMAPTGDYDPNRLINAGSNRWSAKPELGFEQPLGNWFVNGIAGAWFFGDNRQYLGGNDLAQAPLGVVQGQIGYTFRPGLWLAANATYYIGGETSLNGMSRQDPISGIRGGLTLAVPLWNGFAVKLSWSAGAGARAGADVDLFGATLQYRWFDP